MPEALTAQSLVEPHPSTHWVGLLASMAQLLLRQTDNKGTTVMTRREQEVGLLAWLATGLALAGLLTSVVFVHKLQTHRHTVHHLAAPND